MSHWEETGKSDEWYTPKYIFDALSCRFDQDVAAPNDGPMHVPTSRWLSKEALSMPWRGFIWMNPPFGGRNGIEPWLARFIAHGNGIALTPDRTSAPWFQRHACNADRLLFLPKVRFLKPDGTEGKSPSVGTVLWAAGDRAVTALERARDLGLMLQPSSADNG